MFCKNKKALTIRPGRGMFSNSKAESGLAAAAIGNVAKANGGLSHQGDAGWFWNGGCAPANLSDAKAAGKASRCHDGRTDKRIGKAGGGEEQGTCTWIGLIGVNRAND
jgi:hypothetical protein